MQPNIDRSLLILHPARIQSVEKTLAKTLIIRHHILLTRSAIRDNRRSETLLQRSQISDTLVDR
jgi:hypothetical protein